MIALAVVGMIKVPWTCKHLGNKTPCVFFLHFLTVKGWPWREKKYRDT